MGWPSQASEHDADHCKADEGSDGAGISLEVARQAAVSSDPCQCPLDDPALRQDDEAFGLIGSFDDFEVDLTDDFLERALELPALIAAVGVELEKERVEAEQSRHEQRAAVAILNVGGVHDGVHQQALRVDEDMAFLALDLLARIITVRIDVRPPFSALFTLWLSMTAAVGEAAQPARSRHSA